MKKVLASLLAAAVLAGAALAMTGCGEMTLRKKYEDYFLVGATMNSGNYLGYEELASEFSSMTCENEMKWNNLQPDEGLFTYALADEMIDFGV